MTNMSKAWSTSDEFDAIDSIASSVGKYETSSYGKPISKAERLRKLRGYIKSCEHRFFWGNISQSKSIAYAQELLVEIK